MQIDVITGTQDRRVSAILTGLPGQSNGSTFVVDESVREISPMFDLIGSSSNPAPISSEDVVRIEVNDSIGSAVKAQLLASASNSWTSLYASVAGVASARGPFVEAAIRAEQASIAAKIKEFKRKHGLHDFIVPVTVYATVDNKGDYDSSVDTASWLSQHLEGASRNTEGAAAALTTKVVSTSQVNLGTVRSDHAKNVTEAVELDLAELDSIEIDAPTDAVPPAPVAPRLVQLGAPGPVNFRSALIPTRPVDNIPLWALYNGPLAVLLEATVAICARNPEEARTIADLFSGFPDENVRSRALNLENLQVIGAEELLDDEVDAPITNGLSERGG